MAMLVYRRVIYEPIVTIIIFYGKTNHRTNIIPFVQVVDVPIKKRWGDLPFGFRSFASYQATVTGLQGKSMCLGRSTRFP